MCISWILIKEFYISWIRGKQVPAKRRYLNFNFICPHVFRILYKVFWPPYVFFLGFGDLFVLYFFISFIYLFFFPFLGCLCYIFGYDLIPFVLILLSLWIYVLMVLASETVFRSGIYLSGYRTSHQQSWPTAQGSFVFKMSWVHISGGRKTILNSSLDRCVPTHLPQIL